MSINDLAMKITPGTKFKDTDDYISTFPEDVQQKLQQIRSIIKKAVPKAQEVISYNMPAFKQNSVLVYFAGAKNHIGFYPTPSPIEAFQKELAAYKTSKGAIQFPLEEALPAGLITKIVKFRVEQDLQKKVK